jgi:hypothetical protein
VCTWLTVNCREKVRVEEPVEVVQVKREDGRVKTIHMGMNQ